MSLAHRCLAGWFLGLVVSGGFFISAAPVRALSISDQYDNIRSEGIIFANICPNRAQLGGEPAACECRDTGKCSLEDVLQVLVNVSYLVFALAGSAALIAFVYGGFEWITAAGNPDRIKRGKDALNGAVIGLAIIFLAYTFINLLISVLKTGEPATAPVEETIGDGASGVLDTQ